MTELLALLMLIKIPLGAALCLAGGLLAIIGSLGVLRFPDVYTRLHAASVTDTSSVSLAILGMILLSPTWLISFKLVAIWVFFFLTGPTSSHALANAAHVAGLEPMIGGRARGEPSGEDE